MVEITLDGKQVQVPEGSMLMHAAAAANTYVPHFCYHKKLSIAANCRMCLVEVEKAPKPLPACATPVTQGMVVHTKSEKAIKAQQSVMEFLLINHPLDCPICDQGGECQLQDLAVGYGGSSSRYEEEKRVVFHKNLGPLVSAEEMSRCIHCTRCVRFGQEIAGVMELGMLHRGEHAQITAFLGNTVDSELSGNMIDICPVGALTSKPFRYSARTWELSRRKSVSPHDSVGANIIVQVKNNAVMRVVPLENEEVNECWISDRDRFSYEALNGADRLTMPMIKEDGRWKEVDWPQALEAAAAYLKAAQGDVSTLIAPHSTFEEMSLAAQVTRALGSENIDFRLRQVDFSSDAGMQGAPWLGMPIAQLSSLDSALIVGSNLRNDHPLFAARLRQAVKAGAQVAIVNSTDDDLLMPVACKVIEKPSLIPQVLAQIALAVSKIKSLPAPAGCSDVHTSDVTDRIAQNLCNASKGAILLGNSAVAHSQFSVLHALAHWLSVNTGAQFGFLGESGNTVGGYIANARPVLGGKNALAMSQQPSKAVLLVNVEPALDLAAGVTAVNTFAKALAVIALTAFKSAVQDVATIMLPITPFTETSGTYFNAQGLMQSVTGAVKPLGQSRPGWKVLRVLGNNISPDFEYQSSEQVRDAALTGKELQQLLNNGTTAQIKLSTSNQSANGLELVSYVPTYFSDVIVRRAHALSKTVQSKAPVARIGTQTADQLGVKSGDSVRLKAESASVVMPILVDSVVPHGCVQVASAHALTAPLGACTTVVLERV